MSNFDEERESLREAKEAAEQSAKRASQKYEIVQYGQGDLWRKLDAKAFEAVNSLNAAGPQLMHYRQPKRGIGFTLEPVRVGRKPILNTTFDERLHRVVITVSGMGKTETVMYQIRANDENQAEFADGHGSTVDEDFIVREMLAWLK